MVNGTHCTEIALKVPMRVLYFQILLSCSSVKCTCYRANGRGELEFFFFFGFKTMELKSKVIEHHKVIGNSLKI